MGGQDRACRQPCDIDVGIQLMLDKVTRRLDEAVVNHADHIRRLAPPLVHPWMGHPSRDRLTVYRSHLPLAVHPIASSPLSKLHARGKLRIINNLKSPISIRVSVCEHSVRIRSLRTCFRFTGAPQRASVETLSRLARGSEVRRIELACRS